MDDTTVAILFNDALIHFIMINMLFTCISGIVISWVMNVCWLDGLRAEKCNVRFKFEFRHVLLIALAIVAIMLFRLVCLTVFRI